MKKEDGQQALPGSVEQPGEQDGAGYIEDATGLQPSAMPMFLVCDPAQQLEAVLGESRSSSSAQAVRNEQQCITCAFYSYSTALESVPLVVQYPSGDFIVDFI